MRTLARDRNTKAETDSEGTWAVSYGDMVTLLLTFFILFFSTNKDSQGKGKEIQESLVLRLNAELGAAPSMRKPASMDLGVTKGEGIEPTVEEKFGAKIHRVGEKVVVEFPGVSFFSFAETDLTHEGQKALDHFTQAFLPFAGNYQVAVRAYTDNKPVRADLHHAYHDNIELSMMRALSALRYMQRVGIPLRKLKPGGFGELTFPDQASLSKKSGGAAEAGVPLARKIVLVLEPEPKEGV